jgi:hypothetical protein
MPTLMQVCVPPHGSRAQNKVFAHTHAARAASVHFRRFGSRWQQATFASQCVQRPWKDVHIYSSTPTGKQGMTNKPRCSSSITNTQELAQIWRGWLRLGVLFALRAARPHPHN